MKRKKHPRRDVFLRRFDDLREHLWIFSSDLGEDFAVEDDLFLFEVVHECGVVRSVQTSSGIDANLLRGAVVTLFEFAAAVGVDASFCGGDFCEGDFALATPHHSFCAGQDILSTLDSVGTTFNARHRREKN